MLLHEHTVYHGTAASNRTIRDMQSRSDVVLFDKENQVGREKLPRGEEALSATGRLSFSRISQLFLRLTEGDQH
jgi:hypothetical protein